MTLPTTIILFEKSYFLIYFSYSIFSTCSMSRSLVKVVRRGLHQDWVGPPHPTSNLRCFKYARKVDETKEEKVFRDQRIATHNWCHDYWAEHNTSFAEVRHRTTLYTVILR